MLALIRYILAVLLSSQRFLAPLMLFVGIAIMFVVSSDKAPVAGVYGAIAGVLFACSVWLTIILVAEEDPVHRTITLVNAGTPRAVLLGIVLAALLSCLVVSAPLLSLPVLLGQPVTGTDLAAGALAQGTAASTGVAVGLLTSRLVMARTGYSLLTALILVTVFVLVDGLPPVNPVLRLLADHPGSPSLLPKTALYAGVAMALLVVSTMITQYIAARRG